MLAAEGDYLHYLTGSGFLAQARRRKECKVRHITASWPAVTVITSNVARDACEHM